MTAAPTVNYDPHTCDVVVIGGGPGGSTAATLLAERGCRVVLFEKAKHPRFHIGESLLPLNLPLFEQLGVADEVRRIGMPKYGVEFVAPTRQDPVTIEFAEAWDKSHPFSYQVHRAAFDDILFRNAVRKGALAFEECRVTRVEFNSGGAVVSTRLADSSTQSWQCKFVIDASGRDTVLANHFGIKQRSLKHCSAAIFGHFSGATRLPGKAEGHISIFWFRHGWFWFIPLSDGATSVGAVCWPQYLRTRKVPPEQFLRDTIALCPALVERLRTATLISPVTATGNYSYQSARASEQHYLMVGDAFQFIDPVFSTGVFIAMQNAFDAADTVMVCLDKPRRTTAALKAYDKAIRRGPAIFSWYIHRVTTPGLRGLLMASSNVFRLREALLSVLAGDIFRGTAHGTRLLAFKALYYITSLLSPMQNFTAWQQRRRAIRESGISAAPAGE